MEEAAAVGVLVEIEEAEARLELSSDLLLEGVGELDAAILRLEHLQEVGILERIERQGVDDLSDILPYPF